MVARRMIYKRDALIAAGVDARTFLVRTGHQRKTEERPGLTACLKALRPGDTLIIMELDRPRSDLRHLINTVHDLTARGTGV